jgi:hypothetical protein
LYEARIIARGADKEQLFLEVIEKGRVSLYYYKDALDEIHYYMNKGEGELYELVVKEFLVEKDAKTYQATSNRYKGIIHLLMSDYRKVVQKYSEISLNHKSLSELVREYNAHFANASQEGTFSRPVPLFRVVLGVSGGVQMSSIRFTSEYSSYSHLTRSPFDRSITPAFGVFVNTTIPKVNEKLSIHTELLYQTHYYTAFNEHQSFGQTVRNDVSFQMHSLKLPVMVRYTYPKGRVRPYLNIGVAPSMGRVQQNQLITESEGIRTGVVEAKVGEALLIRRSQIGFTGGIGLAGPLWGRHWVFGEIRMERGNGIVEPDIIKVIQSRTSSLYYMLGFGF